MILTCVLGIVALMLVMACPVMFIAVLDIEDSMPAAIGVVASVLVVAALLAYGADVSMRNFHANSSVVEAVK